MGESLDQRQQTHVAEIVNHGEKLILPIGMTSTDAIDLLYRHSEYMEAEVNINEKFDVFPFDGAYGLSQVLTKRYGWTEGKSIRSMFGEQKPQIFKIPCSPTEKVDVPWGQFSLPHVQGRLMTGTAVTDAGRVQFTLSATIKRKDEATIRALFDELRAYLKEHSLYRGKAIKIRFRDNNGEMFPLPEPEFLDTSKTDPENLIFSEELENSVRANLFTPITRVQDCLDNDMKVKRGVLLGGKYGCGKTLAATVAARLAEDSGITYVYTPRAAELADAVAFAKQYQSPACVVFCEDIDREVQGARSVKMDDILNILDGIDTKSENIITVLTTNHLDNINQAMLRPGRLDAIINVEPPDADAAERLVRFYGGDAIPADEPLTEVGETLAGQIPAVIEEAVKRAKLFQLALLPAGERVSDLTAEALRQAAVTMTAQIELLAEIEPAPTPSVDAAISELMRGTVSDNHDKVDKLGKRLESVANAVGA